MQEAQKHGKLEEAPTTYRRKSHVISKLLVRFVLSRIYKTSIIWKWFQKLFQKSSNVLVDTKIIFFNRILHMFIVAASNRSLFGAINSFHNCGPR